MPDFQIISNIQCVQPLSVNLTYEMKSRIFFNIIIFRFYVSLGRWKSTTTILFRVCTFSIQCKALIGFIIKKKTL